jgi:hypothetical protein
MAYFLLGNYMSFVSSTKITKQNDQYIIEFPLIENPIQLTLAFERYKFQDHPTDENEYLTIQTIRFYPDHVGVYIKLRSTLQGLTISSLLNTDVNSIHFICQCIGDMDKDKIKNLTITTIVPELSVEKYDVCSDSSV